MSEESNLTKKDLATVQNYLAKIAHKWTDIGVQLQLDPEYLEKLSSKKRSSDNDNLRKMLLTWLKGEYPEAIPTWRALHDALRTSAVDEVRIADKIKEEKGLLFTDQREMESLTEADPTESESSSSEEESESNLSSGVNDSITAAESSQTTAQDPFPYLNTSGLAAKEKEELHERLLLESTEIRLAFTALISNTASSLLSRSVTGKAIQDELASSELHHWETIAGIDSVHEVMGLLGEHWNFCEYSLLEHIISKFGTHEDRMSLEKYKQSLAAFSQRRLFECPERVFGRLAAENEMTLSVRRTDKSTILHDMTLNQVLLFSSIFKKELDIDESDVRLISCQRNQSNSLELSFGALSSVTTSSFPLSKKRKDKLISLGVWQVTCGEHTFCHENQSASDETDAGTVSDEDKSEAEHEDEVQENSNEPVVLLENTVTCEDEDMGLHTSISINNKKKVVEVSISTSSNFKAYKVGTQRMGSVIWLSGIKGIRYGTGKAPKIALNDEGYVVEVDEEKDDDISCRVGLVHSSNVMLWTESSKFATGSNPTIALCYKTAIAAYRKGEDGYYRIGTLDVVQKSIYWSPQEHRFISGISDLAIASNTDSTVVIVYTKQTITSALSQLYVTVGTLNKSDYKVSFSSVRTLSQSISSGTSPSIALSRGNYIVVISILHKTGIQRKVKYKLGLVKKMAKTNAFDVKWSGDEEMFDISGKKASIAINDRATVLVSHSKKGESYCHVGKIFHETTV